MHFSSVGLAVQDMLYTFLWTSTAGHYMIMSSVLHLPIVNGHFTTTGQYYSALHSTVISWSREGCVEMAG